MISKFTYFYSFQDIKTALFSKKKLNNKPIVAKFG